MYNLIPHFVHEHFNRDERSGQFTAATLFIDVTGFTRLTEMLMQHGKEGAEVLTDALNRIFNPLVRAIYARGGWVASFAGDAFLAIFPHLDDPQQARGAALEAGAQLLAFLRQHGVIATRYGDFTFNARVGLSDGMVRWGILGTKAAGADANSHHTYYFSGPAVLGCTIAESRAEVGQMAADQHIWPLLTAIARGRPHGDCILITECLLPPGTPTESPPPALPREAAQPFVLDTAINLMTTGARAEFRQVVSIFVSFDWTSEMESLLNPFVSLVLNTATEHGGYFNKLDFSDKGPMMLILFGAPLAHENDLERAADFLAALREQTAATALRAVRWRAGVTYGVVYAGIIGSAERCEYTAIGDVVNLASRLTTAAPWGEIYLSAPVAACKTLKTAYLGAHFYKGFTQPQPTYQYVGRETREPIFFEQPMIGRQEELEQLLAATQPLFNGRFGGVIYIIGEAGIGKSHLAHEVQQVLLRRHAVTWFTAQTDQILRHAFNPFTYFLKRYFNQLPGVSDAQNKQRFEARYQTLLATLEARRATAPPGFQAEALDRQIAELRRVQSVLGALVGLHWPGSLYESLEGGLRYQNSLLAIKALLLAEALLKPVVLLLEDLQWLDSASYDVLTTLCRNVSDYPLLILITARYLDDGSPPALPLPANTPLLRMDLKALSPAELRQLTEVTLGGASDEALLTLLQERTQSNPFFVQQFLYYFKENALLERAPHGVWQLKSSLSAEVPTTINALLIARVDRLAQNVKEVVKAAAVLGREFDDRVLACMLAADITAEVRAAEQEQIWSRI
ncbi:MAG TPA: AAA family ATPase [Anaerolineae bacterium]|nr:AAA family ATPase [Anaerolineae bacterium]HQK14975.1 AAA family ATPase [Anaerolineae bacterium]